MCTIYFLMMNDQLFYNPEKKEFTVRAFIDKCEKEFGRIDMVVLWHAYPRIGLDERNQFDFYRDIPGGISRLRKITDEFHLSNIKVFVNYNPWDTGTRREPLSDSDALADLVRDLNADGIFLDTLSEGNPDLLKKVESSKSGVAFESELALPAEYTHNHQMSWAQWFTDTKAPGVLRNKWLERRHMQHGISRWNTDRTPELHTAWMNGSGTMIWENVFGQWIGWSPRDKSLLRSISPIQKRYSELFSGEGWTPLAIKPEIEQLFASQWQKEGIRLWTLVNRSDTWVKGDILRVENHDGDLYYDLIWGKEALMQKNEGKRLLKGEIPPRGVGCFIALQPDQMERDFQEFLASQARIGQTLDLNTDFPALQTRLKPVQPAKAYRKRVKGMAMIPSFKGIQQRVFRVREVGYCSSTDRSFINTVYPALHHTISLSTEIGFPAFLIDETPVTNIMFLKFLQSTGYTPSDQHHFLSHWTNRKIPGGKKEHPVVYINLEDARAYAQWAGKRLPTEGEWQFAGQGHESRKYPWGDDWLDGRCNKGKMGGTTPVRAFPDGRSAFGCFDMCGNVWEMTESEYLDKRNRFSILKGGSFFKAQGSVWYFDGGPQSLDFCAKQLLLSPGMDRCSTVGFRCAADLKM